MHHRNPIRSILTAGLALVFAGLATAASAQTTLYATVGNYTDPGSVATLDQSTAALSIVGPSGVTQLLAVAFDSSGTLWGIQRLTGNNTALVTLNPATGALLTTVGQITTGNAYVTDIAFQPGTGVLYGIDWYQGLVTIDTTTAAATIIADPVTPANVGASLGGGIAFTSSGSLYVAPGAYSAGAPGDVAIYQVDPATGATLATHTYDTGVHGISGLAARPLDDLLFATVSGGSTTNPAAVVALSLSVGNATVGVVGIPAQGLTGVAFSNPPPPVPALPGPIVTFAVALLLLALGHRLSERRTAVR